MTRVRIIDGCLGFEGCEAPGGKRLLCPEHAPIFDGPAGVNAPPLSDALTHGIGITGPDGKHIAIQDYFETTEKRT